MDSSWLSLVVNILFVLLFVYVLYLVVGMANDIAQIRQILERETGT